MPSRVLAHIGLPKTGTTYLQALLYANVEALRRQDVSVVGRHRLHYDAASEVAGAPSRRTRQVPTGAWDRVLRQLGRVETDRAVFSNERYSLVERDGAARMAATIGDTLPGCELHVVLTLRDMVAAEPSAWQEYVKNGGRLGWPEFCAAAVADPPELQRRRRARRMLAVWPELVPPERIHVVTVPPPGSPRGLLLERFCSVLGVDPAGLETTEPGRANTSLDFVATEMLRRVNARAPRLPVEVQRGEIKRFLANGVLSRREASLKPSLSGAALELARGENAWLVETLRSISVTTKSREVLVRLGSVASRPAGSTPSTLQKRSSSRPRGLPGGEPQAGAVRRRPGARPRRERLAGRDPAHRRLRRGG